MSNLDPAPPAVTLGQPPDTATDSGRAAHGPSHGAGANVPPNAGPEPIAPRRAPVGESTTVSRYLPSRGRTTVGAWCFLDHYGPDDVSTGPGMRVGPHPHTGLQTVTWLLEGEVVHHDSLGSHQTIRPGQLNVMTAGSGIAHAELSPDPHPSVLHGLQLWVALPGDARAVVPAFEHHADLPRIDLDGSTATLLVGELAGARSSATTYSPLLGGELDIRGRTSVPLERAFEHALLVVAGSVTLEGRRMTTGACVYLGPGRERLEIGGDPAGRLLLLGGEPFADPLVMWWNFVGRTADEVAEARADWEAGGRFGEVTGTTGERIPAPPLPPGRLRQRNPTLPGR